MAGGYNKVLFVTGGEQVLDIRDIITGPRFDAGNDNLWWVAYVRAEGQPLGCVFGGRPHSVVGRVLEHVDVWGPAAEVVGYAFRDAQESARTRLELERVHAEQDGVGLSALRQAA